MTFEIIKTLPGGIRVVGVGYTHELCGRYAVFTPEGVQCSVSFNTMGEAEIALLSMIRDRI